MILITMKGTLTTGRAVLTVAHLDLCSFCPRFQDFIQWKAGSLWKVWILLTELACHSLGFGLPQDAATVFHFFGFPFEPHKQKVPLNKKRRTLIPTWASLRGFRRSPVGQLDGRRGGLGTPIYEGGAPYRVEQYDTPQNGFPFSQLLVFQPTQQKVFSKRGQLVVGDSP